MRKLLYVTLFAALLVACGKDTFQNIDTAGQSGSITRFAIYNNYMYVLNLNEVQTYNLGQDNKPVLFHTLATDYGLETIQVYDGSIYVGSTTALYILDITRPGAPTLLSKTDPDAFDFVERCDPVVIKNNYVYSTLKVIQNSCGTISANSALVVYDITDKVAPFVVSEILMNIPNGLGYNETHLFVCDEGVDQVVVFDLENPGNPTPTNFNISITDPVDLIINGKTMIVSTKTDFQIYDISDVANIKRTALITK